MVTEPVRHDVLILGAKVVDGSGNPWFRGDVAIRGDRVSAVAPTGVLDRAGSREVVDGGGLVACPGFIDIQSHSIIPFLKDGRSLSKVTQGVTTEIMGENWTPAPFGGRIGLPFPGILRARLGPQLEAWNERARAWTRFGDWLADLTAGGVAVNVGAFVGGATVRAYAMGEAMDPPSPADVATMQAVVDDAMRDGAFGLATALVYPPSAFSSTDELVALCEIVAEHGGVHATHLRSEADRFLEALDEAVAIAQRSGVATEIYHLKAAGRRNWDKLPAALARIDAARDAGIDVGADMYPYVAAGTGLAACLPPWASADGRLYDNLRDPETRARIRDEVLSSTAGWENFGQLAGPEHVLVAGLARPELMPLQGRRLAQIADVRGQDWVDAAMDLLAAEEQSIFTIYFLMSEANLREQMRRPWMKFGTDAGGLDPAWAAAEGIPHPRAYGTYPRILGRYVRDEGVLPLEEAVRKMSSAVADRLGLRDRGMLREGMFADVVLFDPDVVADRSTYADPHQLSVGIRNVWVNGVRVVCDGRHTGALPGRRVSGPGHRARHS